MTEAAGRDLRANRTTVAVLQESKSVGARRPRAGGHREGSLTVVCGRYTLAAELEAVVEMFSVDVHRMAGSYRPRWNVVPGQDVLVVTADARGRRMDFVRWGFSPGPGAPRGRGPWINARSESVGGRPAFRDAFLRRRCLVPADGFFEWAARRPVRQPYWVRPRGGLFAMAGIWTDMGNGAARWSFGRSSGRGATEPRRASVAAAASARGDPGGGGMAVLTRVAPAGLEWLHDRVPVILPPDAWDAWLSEAASEATLRSALASEPTSELSARPVSRAVNDARVDQPECIERVAEVREEQPSLFQDGATGDG